MGDHELSLPHFPCIGKPILCNVFLPRLHFQYFQSFDFLFLPAFQLFSITRFWRHKRHLLFLFVSLSAVPNGSSIIFVLLCSLLSMCPSHLCLLCLASVTICCEMLLSGLFQFQQLSNIQPHLKEDWFQIAIVEFDFFSEQITLNLN